MKTFSTKTSKLLSRIAIAAFLFSAGSANAAQFTSAKTGNWSDPTTWTNNSVPGANDDVSVLNEHVVTVDINNVEIKSLIVQSPQGATAGTSTRLNLNGKTMIVNGNIDVVGGTNDKKIAELAVANGSAFYRGTLTKATPTYSIVSLGTTGEIKQIAPLPVSLTFFKAGKTENGTALTWETASEKNNKGYDVQASADGKNFETVAFVASKNGNANYSQRYEFLDKTSRSGLVYYRLKQTDFDGTVAYYAAKVIDLGKFAENAVAYPNPFQNQFEVKLNGATSLEVTDLTGKTVYRGQIAPGTKNLNIDMNNQPTGIYLLKASAGNSTEISRLIKQ